MAILLWDDPMTNGDQGSVAILVANMLSFTAYFHKTKSE